MSKEWFEKVEDKWDYAYESGKDGGYLSIEDIEGLFERAEVSYRLESEKEDLMMAHDNVHRELADYKRLNQKDKHELIKANISKIRKIEELEHVIEQDERQAVLEGLYEENKRYREAIESVKNKLDIVQYREYQTVDFRHEIFTELLEALEGEE